MYKYFFVAYVVLLTGWVFLKARNSQSGFFKAPFYSWLILMILPFLWQFWSKEALSVHRQHISLAAVYSLLGYMAIKQIPVRVTRGVEPKQLGLVVAGLAVIGLLIQILHVILMPEIPLIAAIIRPIYGTAEVTLLREQSSKLLGLPAIFIYLAQGFLNIVLTIIINYYYRHRKYFLSLLLFAWVCFYSLSTMAKEPILIVLISNFAVFWVNEGEVLKSRLTRVLQMLAGIGGIAALAAFLLYPKSFHYFMPEKDMSSEFAQLQKFEVEENLLVSTADIYRLYCLDPGFREIPFWSSKPLTYFYRILLVPSEVANRWFTYFPERSGGHWGWKSVNGERHVANVIGLWAFQLRFPTLYFDSARAYTSFDADAYGRAGWFGLALVLVFLYLLHIFFNYFFVDDPIGRSFRILFYIYLALFLPQASIPAILAAQGIGILLVLNVAYYYLIRRQLT